MHQLFSELTRAVEGSAGIAMAAAFVWGILSIILSPCHLSSIPLIIGFMSQGTRPSLRRAFLISFIFAFGILVTIAAIGAITAALGRMLGNVGPIVNYFVAAVLIVVGLYLLEAISLPWSAPAQITSSKRGLVAAFSLGLLFGVAIGPCTFAYMAPMLAATFKTATTNLPYAFALLILYGAGHCSVIVAAGTSVELVQRYLDWNESSAGAKILKKICGALVIAGALYLILTT